MGFIIDIRKTNPIGKLDTDDSSVSEAIWTIYSDYENYEVYMLLPTNLVIRLDFRGDLSSIWEDVIEMMNSIKTGKNLFTISFLSSTFTAIWKFSVSKGVICIEPSWTTVNLIFKDVRVDPADYRKFVEPVYVDKDVFVSEWDKLLKEIKNDLLSAGYNKDLEGFEYLEKL